MVRYVAVRLALAAVVLFCLVSLVFFVSRVLGDPASLMAPLDASPKYVEDLRRQLGFADPLLTQYGRFLRGALVGDLGSSTWQQVPALSLVLSRVPATLQLAGAAIVLASVLGITMGMVAARKPGSLVDNAVTALSIVSASTPSFWLALVLIVVLAVYLRLVPTSGYGTWQQFVLPLATLVPLSAGRLAQITRSSVVEVLGLGYIKTAHAKGLRERRVLLSHAFPNAGLPILTVASDELASLLNGSVIVETIFGWPGIGFLTTEAITQRDLAVVTAAVLVIGAQLVLLNLVIDLLYTRLDPRISFH
jgi:peptide/nickel transport system permease protein